LRIETTIVIQLE